MNIAIDMDDTITNTKDMLYKYAKDYASKHNYKLEDILINNNTHIREKDAVEFMDTYYDNMFNDITIKDNCKDVINSLKDRGNKIYIITARPHVNGRNLEEDIKKYLDKYNIRIDGIYAGCIDKIDIIKRLNIDVMIDDNISLYNNGESNNINILLYDEDNNYNVDNKVSSWIEIDKYFRKEV